VDSLQSGKNQDRHLQKPELRISFLIKEAKDFFSLLCLGAIKVKHHH